MVYGVTTGAKAYIFYGIEGSTFGTGATVDRSFGARTAVSNFTLTHNRIDLNRLGQIETADYAYGQQSGSLGVSFVLADSVTSNSNETAGDIFELIFGADTAGVYGGLEQGDADVTSKSATINIGVDTVGSGVTYSATENKVRSLSGCILNTLSISTAVGDTVNCSADFSYGIENRPTSVYATVNNDVSVLNPYTFANATFKAQLGSSTSGVDVTSLELIQDAEINFGLNNELLYQLGSHQSVDSFRRNLEITGRFRLPWSDWVLLERTLAQIGKGATDGTIRKTLNNNDYTDNDGNTAVADLEYKFTNGARNIKIELGGVAITDIAISGIEPVEPIYQELNFKAKTCKVTVTT